MKVGRYLYMAAVVAGLAVSWSLWHPVTAATPPNAQRFVVDPFYPKPLPDNWVTGEIGGTCIDANDHLFAVTRGFQTGGLVSPEGVGGAPKSIASPPVIEFDRDGNVVNAWGDPSLVASGPDAGRNAVLPNGTHGCFVDYQGNVWIGGNSNDGVVQKYSHDGKRLLQIGTKFLCDRPDLPGGAGPCVNASQTGSSRTLLNLPADIAVDPNPDPVTGQRGSVYIADGYGNHRVVVFDSSGKYLRQMGGVGTGPGQFTAGDGGHPHCVVLGADRLVYACDRGQDRINVYTRDGSFLHAIPVIPGTGTPGIGTAGSAWDVDFSPDNGQQFMYVSDGGNEIMWIFDHVANTILAGFGRPGHMAGRGRDGRWSARPEVRAPGQREIQGSRARLSGGRSHPPAAPLRSRQSELTSPSTAGRRTAPGRRSIGPSSLPPDFGGSGPNAGGGTRRFVAAS